MYINVVFVKKLLDVDIIFNIENAIVDDMYFVLCFRSGIWVYLDINVLLLVQKMNIEILSNLSCKLIYFKHVHLSKHLISPVKYGYVEIYILILSNISQLRTKVCRLSILSHCCVYYLEFR